VGSTPESTFFYATIFTDTLSGLAILGFVLWSSTAIEKPRSGHTLNA
jgi:hypothetical protein